LIGANLPVHRDCAWCAQPITVVARPGRPRLYCNHGCRQRAYEFRHGFCHRRTPRSLPGQSYGDVAMATGYERGGVVICGRKAHAMRPSVRPEGPRRETLCGVLVRPTPGKWFNPFEKGACRRCSALTDRHRLRVGISPSNELSRLRALIDEGVQHRLEPADLVRWLATDNAERRWPIVQPRAMSA
jgi:hypothetical protein